MHTRGARSSDDSKLSDTQYTYKCVNMDMAEIVGMGLIDVYVKPRTEEERKNGCVPRLKGEQRERAEKVLTPLWEKLSLLAGDHTQHL